ncbi:MAG: DAK2 domain-containing protein, partial [Acholeplasmataceae bacterium]
MTDYLNNELIYKSFILGAKNVIQEKNGLNAINVFPVPDGDTGSNLASMMQSIIERSKLGKTSEETLQSIADAAIVGARGNSGIIFAQYIYGFSLEVQNEVNKETFTDMLKRAFNYAYQSIAKPVEGTMITVMRAFAHAVDSFKEKGNDFLDILSNAYEAVKIELARTPELLAVLKENKVVDAGAKGFVHFIEGFIKALKGEEIDMTEHESIEHIHVEHLEDSQFRYCTEALLRGSNFDLNNIRQSLAKDGDSLVVAGSDKTVRIHIHSDHPDQVFEKLSKLGT